MEEHAGGRLVKSGREILLINVRTDVRTDVRKDLRKDVYMDVRTDVRTGVRTDVYMDVRTDVLTESRSALGTLKSKISPLPFRCTEREVWSSNVSRVMAGTVNSCQG